MIRLYVIVEGDTEQEFVKQSLAPHLNALSVWTTPIEVTTKRDRKTGQKLAQGGGHWTHWRKDIRTVLRSNAAALLARVPGYNKTTHGPLVTTKVGIEGLKQRCPRFGAWVGKLEALGGEKS